MFAIIKSGGKQYRIQQEQTIAVEKLPGEVGARVALRDVLMLGSGGAEGVTVAGEPLIADACVHAEIIKQDRLPKIRVFKKKRRKKYKRTLGHRQQMTWLRIDGIEAPEGLFPEPSARKPAKKAMTKTAAKATTKTAAEMTPEATPKSSAAETAATKKTAAETERSTSEREPDRLVELPGVGEATEKKLHEAGIKYYEDIIQPGEAILANIEESPALAKLIKDENVVKAAKALVKNKNKKE